jgi:hypothetical protein
MWIDPEKLDEAARFVMKLQGDALWERMPEHFKERYRDKVKHILILCDIDPTREKA